MADPEHRDNEAAPVEGVPEIIPETPAGDLSRRGEDGLTPRQRSNLNLAPPFKPGQSGNPGGRPKGTSLTDRLRTILAESGTGKEVSDALMRAGVQAALKGDFRFWKEILDRIDGPVKQQLEASLVMYAKAIDREAFDGA